MTAATVSEWVSLPVPTMELVLLTLTDGETFVSRKFKAPKAAIPFWMENTDGDINATISSQTVTVNAAGASDSSIGLLIIGGQHS